MKQPADDQDALFNMSVLVLKPLLRAAEKHGVDVEDVLATVGIPAGTFQRCLGRLDSTRTVLLIAELERRVGHVPLAIEAVETLEPRELGVLGLVVMAAETLRDAALLGSYFFALAHDTAQLFVQEDARFARIGIRPTTSRFAIPALMEFGLATIGMLARRQANRDLCAIEVRFSHPEPRFRRELELSFRAPVVFGAEENAIVFPQTYLDLPVVGGNAIVKRVLMEAGRRLLEESARRDDVFLTRRAIADALRQGDASLAAVASRLGTSGRTLQRRLQAHGTSHQTLLEEVRRSLAVHDLSVPGVDVGRVAEGLGFSDGSTFARAFRRWTRTSPTACRRGGLDQRSMAPELAFADRRPR